MLISWCVKPLSGNLNYIFKRHLGITLLTIFNIDKYVEFRIHARSFIESLKYKVNTLHCWWYCWSSTMETKSVLLIIITHLSGQCLLHNKHSNNCMLLNKIQSIDRNAYTDNYNIYRVNKILWHNRKGSYFRSVSSTKASEI